MSANEMPSSAVVQAEAADLLSTLLHASAAGERASPSPDASAAATATAPLHGVVIGELLAIAEDSRSPLVRYPKQPGMSALAARTAVDLHGAHIGHSVALMFENGDPALPIVMGVLQTQGGWPLAEPPAQVQVDTDGQRMIVSAKDTLVLRCGKASITLTKAGKVLIEGSYVLSRSSGVNRIKGGSVQLN